MTGRRGIRHKQLPYDFQEKKGHCNLIEEALDRMAQTSFWKSVLTCLMTDNRMMMMMMKGTFPELKRPGREAKISSPYSAEV